jgi:hypothetical protein
MEKEVCEKLIHEYIKKHLKITINVQQEFGDNITVTVVKLLLDGKEISTDSI